jgi:hypothetical protein
MARVYRDMRAARIDTQEGTRLCYVLAQLSRLIELADLEQRITKLENTRHESEAAH